MSSPPTSLTLESRHMPSDAEQESWSCWKSVNLFFLFFILGYYFRVGPSALSGSPQHHTCTGANVVRGGKKQGRRRDPSAQWQWWWCCKCRSPYTLIATFGPSALTSLWTHVTEKSLQITLGKCTCSLVRSLYLSELSTEETAVLLVSLFPFLGKNSLYV